MTKSGQPSRRYKDATERPGAIVIHPRLDPDMVYDPETRRVTDRRTGEYFISRQMSGMNGIYWSDIRDESGELITACEYRYGDSLRPDGEHKTVNEIIWTLRGEDARKSMREQIAGRERARNDSLERLASFMRSRRIGLYGGIEKGEIVLVDRRMDDLRWERHN